MTAVTLETPLRSVVGAAATKLRTQWDLHTVGDLLEFLPRTYLDATRPTDFRTLTEGEHVLFDLVGDDALDCTRTAPCSG